MGRKSKAEEARAYARTLGVDLDAAAAGEDSRVEFEVPDDPQQIVVEFTTALYTQMKLGDLKGVALVQGLKAIASIADSLRPAEVEDVSVREVDEVLADAGLPAHRRVELGREEIERLRGRKAALELLVARLEGEG